jgi:glucuronoarabinoxylan endo-1,4-beta-xylanase
VAACISFEMVRKLSSILIVSTAVGLAFFAWSASAQTAVINWTDTRQVIDGFGGASVGFYEPFSPQMADFFFTTSGIGLSLLRIQVLPSAADCVSFYASDGGSCLKVPSGSTILTGELAVAKQAANRGVTVWASPWSPPSFMKTNGTFINGGSLLPQDYSAWADSLAEYVKMLDSYGVPLYAISVQNEPDITQNYGSASYTPDQIRAFVPHLYSALQSAGVGSTKIMIPETSHWDFSLAAASMRDPDIAAKVGILAAHAYGSSPIVAPQNYGKHVWQTEVSSVLQTYDGSMEDGLYWAVKIHTYLTVANVNAWHWWFLSDGPKFGNGPDNTALTDLHLNYPKRAYVTGQWSKFIRPGWFRIGVGYSSGPLLISAFKDPGNHSFAIVAVNPSAKKVSQTFLLSGYSTRSVTPWITSTRQSLSAQSPISVSGTSFTYSIPASSVTTFVGEVSIAP